MDIGLVFVGAFERRQDEVENGEGDADRQPGNNNGFQRRRLRLGVGFDICLKAGQEVLYRRHRIKTVEHERYPESQKNRKECEGPQESSEQIDQSRLDITPPQFRDLFDLLQIALSFNPIGFYLDFSLGPVRAL